MGKRLQKTYSKPPLFHNYLGIYSVRLIKNIVLLYQNFKRLQRNKREIINNTKTIKSNY